ncbi:hypothetical protein DFH09DRAFT_1070448 [Mycena vulgaris]|nr:hypothetical protein DFH09DRAFT_1070448 [Mycena vulgaris]
MQQRSFRVDARGGIEIGSDRYCQRLETLLDAALATLSLIHDSAITPISYPDRVTDVLEAMNRRIFAPTSVTLPPASHTAPICPPDAPSPQRPGTKATYARAVSAKPPTSPFGSTSSDPSDPSDIVVRAIRESVVSATGQRLFAGVRWTRNSNLVIQVERGTGTTAYMIDTYAHKLWDVLRPLLRFPAGHPHPTFDTGDSWHSVVFHNVPALQRKHYTLSGIRDSLCSGGFDHAVKAFSILCDDNELDRRRAAFLGVPVRVSVLTATAAEQLVQEGGNLIGGRYCATHYIPRPRDTASVAPGPLLVTPSPAPTTVDGTPKAAHS